MAVGSHDGRHLVVLAELHRFDCGLLGDHHAISNQLFDAIHPAELCAVVPRKQLRGRQAAQVLGGLYVAHLRHIGFRFIAVFGAAVRDQHFRDRLI